MRTTVTIDEDVLAEARARAAARGTSIGHELSLLARRGVEALREDREVSDKAVMGFRPFTGGRAVTTDDVERVREETG